MASEENRLRPRVTWWMATNAAVARHPAGNLKPVMDRSAERIDGIVALIMAIGRAMVAKEQVLAAPMAPERNAQPHTAPGTCRWRVGAWLYSW